MKSKSKLFLLAVSLALLIPGAFRTMNAVAAGTVWPNVNIWFSANEINSNGGWEITDPSCIGHPEAQTQSSCMQVMQPSYTDQTTCQTQICAGPNSSLTGGYCNAAGYSMVNRGTWQNVCSNPTYTTQLPCVAQAPTWTPPSGPCSNPAYTTAGSCTTAYIPSGNTWYTGGCSDPIYTTQDTCTGAGTCSNPTYTSGVSCTTAANTWTPPSGPCSNPAYTTQLTCSLATWNGSTCSNPLYTTQATCTSGAAWNGNNWSWEVPTPTWSATPYCSNPSYTDAISCSTVSTGNTWSLACTATWANGNSVTRGYYGTLALCSNPAYTDSLSCTTNGGDWQQLWSGSYNGGCQRCHDYGSQGNDNGTDNGISFPLTAHKNALRRVTPGVSLGGSDWTSTNSTVPTSGNLSGGRTITYEFPDVAGAAPYTTDLSGAEYIIGGWYRNVKRAQILRTPVTSNEPVIMTDDTCAECHATGYVGTWGVGVGRYSLTGGANQWLYDGVQCATCHSGTTLYNGSGYSIMSTPPLPATSPAGTQICTYCHQQRAGVTLQPYQLAVNGLTGEFSGYAIGNQFLNSPHAQFSGTSGDIGKWTMYNSAFSNTSTAVCSDPQYTTGATCTAVSGNTWGGRCSDPQYTTASTCTAVSGNAWNLFASNNGCVICHDPHLGSVDPDVMDPTNSMSNIKSGAHCQSCHTNTWTSSTSTCSDPAYTDALSCTSASPYTTKIVHSSGAGTPMDHIGQPGYDSAKAIELACITCHMGPDLNHLLRINPSSGYSVNPGGSGDVLANTSPDLTYVNAVWMELDTACGQCHGGGADGSGHKAGVPALSRTQLAAMAPFIHSTYADIPDASCRTCHNEIVPGTNHHGASTSCGTCHTDHVTVPPTTDSYCATCHNELVATMNHPQAAMFTALTCGGCHNIANTTYPGANPGILPCAQCHGAGGVWPLSNATLTARANRIHQAVPDLVVLNTYVTPTTVAPSGNVSITDATVNQSVGGTAGASHTAFYVVSACTTTPSGTAAATRPVPSLGPGANSSAITSVPMPSTAGTYYIVAQANSNPADGVTESDTTNNTKCSGAITVTGGLPDLYIAAVSAPASATHGTPFSVTDRTANKGAANAGVSTTGVYVADGDLTGSCPTSGAGATLLNSRAVPIQVPSGGNTGSMSVTIATTGTKTLIWMADSGGVVSEGNENNNTYCKKITVN